MSNRTFSVMKQNVANMIQDTDASMLSLIGNYINDRYVEIARRLNVLGSERTDYTLSVSVGTSDYQLPDDFGKALVVRDSTNSIAFSEITSQERIDRYNSVLSSNSTPVDYTILDSMVASQPTSASVVTIVSSDNTDSATVYIRGMLASGVEDSESIVLIGTSSQAGTKSFVRILSISKSATTTGVVTVTSNSGGVTNAVIAPKSITFRCKIIRFSPTPANAFTASIVYLQRLLPLSNDYDVPIIDCDDILEAGATADAQRYKKMYARAADWEAIFEKRFLNLAFDRENSPNMVHRFNPKTYRRDSLYFGSDWNG